MLGLSCRRRRMRIDGCACAWTRGTKALVINYSVKQTMARKTNARVAAYVPSKYSTCDFRRLTMYVGSRE